MAGRRKYTEEFKREAVQLIVAAACAGIGSPVLMAARMLWRGVRRGIEAWTESVQHALMFTVPYMGVQLLIQLVRRRPLRHSHIDRSDRA